MTPETVVIYDEKDSGPARAAMPQSWWSIDPAITTSTGQWSAARLGRERGLVGGLLDLSGADAGGADVDPLGGAVDQGADPLDVGVPPALGPAVRVADAHTERGMLAAHLTHRCHLNAHLPVVRSRERRQD